jgi:class 3 adenylate cyclase
VKAVIERFNGHVALIVGDGLLAYFGWPRSNEHDAERAVRAGLAINEAVRGLDWYFDTPAQVRIGIATGLVVVAEFTEPTASPTPGSPAKPPTSRHGCKARRRRAASSSPT